MAAGGLEAFAASLTIQAVIGACLEGAALYAAYQAAEKLDTIVNNAIEGNRKNNNPFEGPVKEDVMVGDPYGNIIPVPEGHQLGGSKDGKCIQQKDEKGKPTGLRMDGRGHHPSPFHQDPRSQRPHGHVPGVTNPDGTPWLSIY